MRCASCYLLPTGFGTTPGCGATRIVSLRNFVCIWMASISISKSTRRRQIGLVRDPVSYLRYEYMLARSQMEGVAIGPYNVTQERRGLCILYYLHMRMVLYLQLHSNLARMTNALPPVPSLRTPARPATAHPRLGPFRSNSMATSAVSWACDFSSRERSQGVCSQAAQEVPGVWDFAMAIPPREFVHTFSYIFQFSTKR